MAELTCSMVCVYLAGAWSWVGRAVAENEGLMFRPCTLPLGHDGAHLLGQNSPPHSTCVETTTSGDLPNRTYMCGVDCPRPAAPDPDRERRRARRADVERRRAARALDDLIAALGIEMTDDQRDCIERWAVDDPSRLQHKSNYGATANCEIHGDACAGDPAPHNADSVDPCAGGKCVDPAAHAEGAHDL